MTQVSTTSISTRTTLLGSGLLVGLAVAVTALVWQELPAQMAIHWDATGSADGYASRTVGGLVLPAIAAVLAVGFPLLPRIDPLGTNFESFRDYYNGFILLMIAFLVTVHGVVLAANLGYDVALIPIITGFTGVIFIFGGFLLRVAEQNWFVGIRTPWTLSSKRVWDRTHAVGSVLMAVVGVVIVTLSIVGLFVELGNLPFQALLGGSVLIAVFSFLYSFYLYVRLDSPDDQARTQ